MAPTAATGHQGEPGTRGARTVETQKHNLQLHTETSTKSTLSAPPGEPIT